MTDAAMTDMSAAWSLPWTGGCRCGALRFRVSAPPLLSAACHCRGCQRMSGGAFALTLMIPAEGFEVTSGADRRCGVGAAMEAGHPAPDETPALPHEAIDHRECALCGSWTYTRLATWPMVNLRTPMLDDPSWAAPFIETMTDEALPFVSAGAARSFAGFPSPEEMQALAEAHARDGARPGRPMRRPG